jgi:D-glycero-alpha-D-manno-heptose-7-phosphate kinase
VRSVRARSWCRVDLAGGTLDIWPLGLLHAGARTVNVAVSLPVTVTVCRRAAGYLVSQDSHQSLAETVGQLSASPETALVGVVAEALEAPPIEVLLASAAPRGSGLGASSAMTVALLAALTELLGRPRQAVDAAASLARDLEARLMALPTGRQDHFPAILGGALEIRHVPGGEQVRGLAVDLSSLGESLVVAYTGSSHFSAANNWEIVKRRLDGEQRLVDLLDGISEIARQMVPALEAGDLALAGLLMAREWSLRRQLAPGISTPAIEHLLESAIAQGAFGGKACGAGAGGCVAILTPPRQRAKVEESLLEGGATVLSCAPAATGLSVENC